MADSLGQGLLDSLKGRAKAELRRLFRQNPVMRRARYPLPQRVVRAALVGRPFVAFLLAYGLLDVLAVAAEWAITARWPHWLPGWTRANYRDFLTNVGSYFITAQVGMLGIVSVAVGIVSFLAQGDGGSSARTDVRLYYVEAMAYEVVTSGIALLVVLSAQLFWPLQYGLHLLGWGSSDQVFKVALAAVHALWLAANLLLFYQFITTTLRFVEPRARERLRERYSANVVIPRDLTRRLMGVLYLQAPDMLVGKLESDHMPRITFGYGLLDAATVEMRRDFRRPTQLTDVWLAPVGLALRGWLRRCQVHRQPRNPYAGPPTWPGQLAIKVAFDAELRSRDWVVREGGVPLSAWEKALLRLGFRFSRVDERARDLPTPDEFIEELADKLVGQIAKSSITGFKAAMDELTRYHRFLLDIQATRDDQGRLLNLAQVGGFFQRPDQGWIQLYRRVLDAGAQKIGSEPHFMDRLSHLTQALLPTDATGTSPQVITTLLELGKLEVVVLEIWFTRHSITEATVAGGSAMRLRTPLAGSDERAFEGIVRNFVGAWESILKLGLIAYKRSDLQRSPPAEHWAGLASSWAFLQAHLHACAYFFAFAVWNQDELSAERYRDLLVRWLQPFYDEVRDHYLFHRSAILTPGLTAGDWANAERMARLASRFPTLDRFTPGGVFGAVVKGAFEDVVVVSAAVALSWYMDQAQTSDIGGRAADRLLRKQPLPGQGSDLIGAAGDASAFQRVMATILRSSLGSGDSRYGASLDGLTMTLNGLSAGAMVPGRSYVGWGADDVDSLAPALLAMLAAHAPAAGDEGLGEWLTWLIVTDGVFADREAELRALGDALRSYVNGLERLTPEILARGTVALNPDADPVVGRARVGEILAGAISVIDNAHVARLRATPVDPAKLAAMRTAVAAALLRDGPAVSFLMDLTVGTAPAPSDALQQEVFHEFDKGAFVTPALSVLDFDAYDAVEMARTLAGNHVVAEFNARPRERVVIEGGLEAFWRTVVERAKTIERPMMLVPSGEVADNVLLRRFGGGGLLPDEFQVEHHQNMPGGGGVGYVGTVEGIHVFQCGLAPGRAMLYTGACLQRVTYAPLRNVGEIAEVELVEEENPEKSGLRIRIAQSLQWSEDPIIWLEASGTVDPASEP